MNQSVNCVEIWDMFLFLNQFCEYRIDFCIDTDGIGPIVLGIVLKSEIRVLPTTTVPSSRAPEHKTRLQQYLRFVNSEHVAAKFSISCFHV